MTNPMLNDLAARRRLMTEDGDMILEGDSPGDLDRARQLAAAEGREILLNSDATPEQIAVLVDDPGLDEISARMHDAGAILQPLPASYNPDPNRRDRVDLWIDPEDRFIYLGLTKDAEAGDVVIRAARMLAAMLDIDGGTGTIDEEPLTDVVSEALMRSFSLRLAARHGHEEAIAQRLHALTRRLQQSAQRGALGKQIETESGILLWACLTAVNDNDRPFVRAHVQRFAPVAAKVAQMLEARIGTDLPDDALGAARVRQLIEAVLAAPEVTGRPRQTRPRRSPADQPQGKKPPA